jgi:hypothetical protein
MKTLSFLAFVVTLMSLPSFAQEKNDCDKPVVPIKTTGKASLTDATRIAMAAVTSAQCQMGTDSTSFKLTTAEFDFQTATEKDGTLEVLFIGGLAGELDKTVTTEADFTYSVKKPAQTKEAREYALHLSKAPTPEQTLAGAIVNAQKQLDQNSSFEDLKDAKVAITITYAFKKDGTIELEPKFGSVSITGKVILTKTTTQKITLTFEKK